MNFLEKVFGFIKHAAVHVGAAFQKIVGHDRAVDFAHSALNVLQSDLGKIAMAVVVGLESQGGVVDKASLAAAKIAEQAKAAGIDAKDSIVRLLIELAVGVIKGHFGPGA